MKNLSGSRLCDALLDDQFEYVSVQDGAADVDALPAPEPADTDIQQIDGQRQSNPDPRVRFHGDEERSRCVASASRAVFFVVPLLFHYAANQSMASIY